MGRSGGHARRPLLGRTLAELKTLVEEAGFPVFRADQLYHWLYRRAALSFDEMHNLAREFRSWLGENHEIGHIEIADVRQSHDGSKKILFRLSDGKIVESVLMPEFDPTGAASNGGKVRWFTLCL